MATTINLVPTNEVSNRLQIASTTTWKLATETPDNGTAVATSIASTSTNTTNWFQVTPGATNATGQASLPTTPNGKGWICELDYTSAGGTGLQNATQAIKLNLTVGSGCTFTVDVMCWVLTLPSSRPATSITSQSQIGSTISVTGVTSATTNPVSFSLVPGAAFALGANQYLYFEVWIKQTTSGTTHTLAVGANVGTSAVGWAASLDDSGTLINGTTNVAEVYQWNNKIGFYRNKFGCVRAVVSTANAIRVASSNAVPNTALANALPIEFQITAGGSTQNTEFVTTAGPKVETINNPICQSIQITSSSGYSTSAYVSQLTTWFGIPIACYTQYWGSATSVSFTIMGARYANAANGTAGAGCNTSNAATNTNFSQSTSAAGAEGWGYTTGATSTAGMMIIPDRHRASTQLFTFVDAGTNTGTSTINLIADNTANATATSWGGRELIYVDATANIGTTSKDKYLNNYNKHLNGPPTISNARLSINTGTVKADSDSAQSSILSGFDYETMAYRITASTNSIKASLQALASYALPLRCFIIESYTASTAPVVGTNATSFATAYAALDSGVNSNAGVTYKGTNYASFVDTVAQVAYVVIFGEQTANTTTFYQIASSLSTAWTQTLTETVTGSDTIAKQGGKALAESLTGTDAIASKSIGHVVTDTVTGSDAVAKLTSKGAMSESLTGADVLTKKGSKGLTESLTGSDAVTSKAIQFHPPADSLTGSDALAKTTSKAVMAESLTGSDTIAKQDSKGLAESVTGTDAIQGKSIGHVIADSLTGSDTTSKRGGKGIAESLTGTDALAKQGGKGLAESVTGTDAVTSKSIGHVVADSLTGSDAVTSKAIQFHPPADTVTSTDALAKQESKGLIESLTSTDTLAKQGGKWLADSLTGSDTIARATSRGLAENLTGSDTIAKHGGKGLAESVTGSDAVTSKSIGHMVADSLTGSDALAKTTSKAVMVETVTETDTLVNANIVHIAPTLTETITGSDAITSKNIQHHAPTDTVTGSDTLAKTTSKAVMAEAITETDALVSISTFHAVLTLSETLTGSDAVTSKAIQFHPPADSLTGSDALAKTTSKAVMAEAITSTDAIQSKSIGHVIADSLTGSDTIARATSRGLAENLTGSDTIAKHGGKGLAESVTNTDAVTSKSIGHGVADSLASSDTLAKATIKGVMVETITPTDALPSKSIGHVVADSLTGSDAVTSKGIGHVVADSLTGSDALARATSRGLTESLTGSDTIAKQDSRGLVESLTPTDAVTSKAIQFHPPLDTLTGSDTLAKTTARRLAETITPADAITNTAVILAASLSESLVGSDTLVKATTRGQAETVTPADASVNATTKSTMVESLTPTDTVAKRGGKGLVESLTGTDVNVTSPLVHTMTLSERLAPTDTPRVTRFQRMFTDKIQPYDVISVGRFLNFTLMEIMASTDAPPTRAVSKALVESLAGVDTLDIARAWVLALDEWLRSADVLVDTVQAFTLPAGVVRVMGTMRDAFGQPVTGTLVVSIPVGFTNVYGRRVPAGSTALFVVGGQIYMDRRALNPAWLAITPPGITLAFTLQTASNPTGIRLGVAAISSQPNPLDLPALLRGAS